MNRLMEVRMQFFNLVMMSLFQDFVYFFAWIILIFIQEKLIILIGLNDYSFIQFVKFIFSCGTATIVMLIVLSDLVQICKKIVRNFSDESKGI